MQVVGIDEKGYLIVEENGDQFSLGQTLEEFGEGNLSRKELSLVRHAEKKVFHDPRKHPQAGDMLSTENGRKRIVVRIDEKKIFYRDEEMKEGRCSIKTWKQWCRDNNATAV